MGFVSSRGEEVVELTRSVSSPGVAGGWARTLPWCWHAHAHRPDGLTSSLAALEWGVFLGTRVPSLTGEILAGPLQLPQRALGDPKQDGAGALSPELCV